MEVDEIGDSRALHRRDATEGEELVDEARLDGLVAEDEDDDEASLVFRAAQRRRVSSAGRSDAESRRSLCPDCPWAHVSCVFDISARIWRSTSLAAICAAGGGKAARCSNEQSAG